MLLAWSWPLTFDEPVWLWLLLLVPILAGVSMRTLRALEGPRRAVVIVLRCLVIIALTIALAEVHRVKRNDNVAVMVVMDRSKSIPDDLRGEAREFISSLARAKEHNDDRIGLIGFDGRADIDMIPSRPGVQFVEVPFGLSVEPDRTDIGAGIRLAMATFPEGYARRIVVLTDGNENMGDFKDEIEAARANNITVDVVPLSHIHTNEILFDRMMVPAQVQQDRDIHIRMFLKSKLPTKARLTLRHNGQEVPLPEAERIISLDGGMVPQRFDFTKFITEQGIHRFEAEVTPLSDRSDSIVENNRATAFTFVEGQGKVLILSGRGSKDDRVMQEALLREKIVRNPEDLQLHTVDEYTVEMTELLNYGAIILSNISADEFNEEQHKALASYVRDFGGGLIMTGGDQSFGAGGWIGTPIEEISPVTFEIKHKKIIPRGALAIIMHSCEIPRGNYWGEQVAIAAVKAISSKDYLGVICYSPSKGGPNWDVPLAQAADKGAVIAAIKNMQIGDMPDFATTMSVAVRDLMALKGVSQRHMIIISDGDPQPPSQATINLMRSNEITCSTVGIGYGSHVTEQTLIGIANASGGRFYPVKNPRTLPQIFIKEAKVVKRSLLVDEPFQPQILNRISPTLAGLGGGEMPPLGGLVLTSPKPEAILAVVRQSTDGNDPVLAHWNVEMGKMVVFTSGMWPSWGSDWAKWESFGKFWAQVVQWVMRQEESSNFDINTRLEGNKGKIYLNAYNKNKGYLNFLRFQGRLLRPDMSYDSVQLMQTGPGQYEAAFDVNDAGNYLAFLDYTKPDGSAGKIRTGLSMSYSPEFRDLDTNFSLLTKAAERTGGRMLQLQSEAEKVFSKESLLPHESRQPIWRDVLMWILLPLFLLDVASRRLASVTAMSFYVEAAVLVVGCAYLYQHSSPWWGYLGMVLFAELVGWAIRWRAIAPTLQYFTYSVRASAQAERASAASLSHLKDVREKVRDDIASGRTEKRREDQTTPAADPRARFDLGESAEKREVADLTNSLGGAKKDDTTKRPTSPGTSKPASEGEGMTSRLLRAKRRAQDDMKRSDDEKKD